MNILWVPFFCGLILSSHKNKEHEKTEYDNQERFFSSNLSAEAERISKDLGLAYGKVFGNKQNLITQVISKDDKSDWYVALQSIISFVEKKSPEFSTKLDILFGVSNFIFIKLDDVYKTEIVNAINDEKDKLSGIKDFNALKLDLKKLDIFSIENKLKHGQKIYVSMLGDFKKEILKYNGKEKNNVKDVLLKVVSLIENVFGKISQSLVNIKNFANYSDSIISFNPKTLRVAYNLIGYKVDMQGLNQNSSPYDILGLRDWEKNNLEHIKMKHKNLVASFAYLKNNFDVQDKLYEIIVSILNEAIENIVDNFKQE